VTRYRVLDDRTEVFAHRTASVLALAATAVLAVASVVLLVADPRGAAGWVGVIAFVGGGAVLARRATRRGLLTGRPALVLNEEGLADNRTGLVVRWQDVRSVEARWSASGEGQVQRSLGLSLAETTESVDLALLAVSQAELSELVRRYWTGEIAGSERVDLTAPRRSRAVRLLRWSAGWAIPLALGAGVVALVIWLRG
jgi:hypothetical protein